jgi:hypothetical protein
LKIEVWPNGVVIVPESPLEDDALRRWKERRVEVNLRKRYIGGDGIRLPGYESWSNLGYHEIHEINVHFPDPDAPPPEGGNHADPPLRPCARASGVEG